MENKQHDPGTLAKRYAPAVYRLAYARTGCRADAEDVMQEVFLWLIKARPTFDSEAHAKAWLLRVAANCANDLFRRPWRSREVALKENLPAGAKDRVIFRPSDVVNSPCTDEVLPQNLVVLAPDQNPMPLADTQDMWISSMGLASDGYFHVRLGFAEGVTPEEGGFFCDLFQSGSWDDRLFVCQQTLVEGGMDILFPLIRRDDLALIQRCKARFYGPYTRLGQSIEGSWTASFQMEHYPSAVLDWTGELLGRQVRKVTVSPLSVTMYSNDSGGFHSTPLYAVRKDGTTVAAEPDTGRYSAPVLEGESLVQDAFNTWKFEEPVNVADIAGLRLEDETIPVN